jgi:hypothetical protein
MSSKKTSTTRVGLSAALNGLEQLKSAEGVLPLFLARFLILEQ